MSVIVKLIPQSDTSSAHLRGLQNYIAKPEANQESGLDVWYFNAFDEQSAQAEMLAFNKVNSRARSTFKHLLISFSPEVFPTRDQAHQASHILLKEMGLDMCVAMVGMHYDKDHVHLHVAVVTIDPGTEKSVHAQWAIEAMHRAAAKINFVQGWKSQDNQLYSVLDLGGVAYTFRNSKKKRTLRANEVTAFQAQRPAGDIASEIVKTLLQDKTIDSWDQFHQRLADSGIEYKQKGSGSIFMIQQDNQSVAVKASVVNRKTTLKHLEAVFGSYTANTHTVKSRTIEPIMGMDPTVKTYWDQFLLHKSTLASDKKTLKQEHMSAYDILQQNHKAQRDQLNHSGWQGRGAALNQARKALAVIQADEKTKLKKKQQLALLQFVRDYHQRHGPTSRFDDYLAFCNQSLLEQHRQQQRQIKQAANIYPSLTGQIINNAFRSLVGIDNCTQSQETMITKAGQQTVIKFANEDGRVDFIDLGNRIDVINLGSDSVRAILQLANQKWQTFHLTGSYQFKFLCAKEAIKLGITEKITNPEVMKIIEIINIQKTTPNKQNVGKKWNQPFKVERKTLYQIPSLIEESVNDLPHTNAYIRHAIDLQNKVMNDYDRDLQIAIRLQATGLTDAQITQVIQNSSPIFLVRQVHTNYPNHLIKVMNSPMVKNEWQPIIANCMDKWKQITDGQSQPYLRPRPPGR